MKGGGLPQLLRPAELVARRGARHVHDPALAARRHAGDHRLREVGRRMHVHLEGDAAPLQREARPWAGRSPRRRCSPARRCGRRTARARAGRSWRGSRRRRGPPRSPGRARRAGGSARASRRGCPPGGRAPRRCARPGDARALGGEAFGERGADAAARAGDDGVAAAEASGHQASRSWIVAYQSKLPRGTQPGMFGPFWSRSIIFGVSFPFFAISLKTWPALMWSKKSRCQAHW